MAASMESGMKIRVLELYSGIGGMHWALKESGVEFEIVAAIDLNTTANQIYKHNFPDVNLRPSNIDKLTTSQFEKWNIDAILMSPPCQPFTRMGKKKDTEDIRTKSFLHVLNLISNAKKKPCYILVENVKGFEESDARDILVDTLRNCDYNFQEFLLTPLQAGVPNCRLRYYLIATLKADGFQFQTSEGLAQNLPDEALKWLTYHTHKPQCDTSKPHCDTSKPHCDTSKPHCETSKPHCDNSKPHCDTSKPHCDTSKSCDQTFVQSCDPSCDQSCDFSERCSPPLPRESSTQNGGICDNDKLEACLEDASIDLRQVADDEHQFYEGCQRLDHFLEQQSCDYFKQYLLGDKELSRFVIMDIVQPSLRKCACFTRRYGHFVEGAGSLISMTKDVKALEAVSQLKSEVVNRAERPGLDETQLDLLRSLQLRYFTPREIASLLCFPQQFGFPEDLSTIQLYRCLGNSLNVHVVSLLIRLMTL